MIDEETPKNVEDAETMMRLVTTSAPPIGIGPATTSPDNAREERALVRRAQDGDSDAFAQLIERRTPGVLAFLRRMLGDAEDARDVAQLTFLKVWENLEKYDSAWAFSTWLFRIASNLAIDSLRSRKSRHRTEQENFRLLPGGKSVADPDGPAGLERKDVRRMFEACSSALSDKQKAVFVLREFEEKESADIARILNCQESTVRNHLFQARRILREEIRKRFPEFVPRSAS